LLLAGAASLAVACGSQSTGAEGSGVVEPGPCSTQSPSPITERQLKRAFSEEGIKLYRDDRCHPTVLVSLTNIPIGAGLSSDETERIEDEQGHILCDLRRDSLGVRVERFVWRNDPQPTYVRVLNIDCAIYPQVREDTDAVERAIRTLPGVSAAPATPPGPDATSD
jgi:hypothetical protein